MAADGDDSGLSRDGLSDYKTLPMSTELALPKQIAWRLTKFPLLPAEVQHMIWEEALRPVMNNQPRLIPVGSLLPPSQETHSIVRVLAQTCGASRELVINKFKLLDKCKRHEELHYLAFPRATPERTTVQDERQEAAAGGGGGPAVPGQQVGNAQHLVFPITAPALAAAAADDGEANEFDGNPEAASASGNHQFQIPLKNPLDNHIHVDIDYFLFFQENFRWMCESTNNNRNILTHASHLAAPLSTWYSFFRSHQLAAEPSAEWLITGAKSLLFLLPTGEKLWCNPIHDPGLAQAILDENARWSQAVEVPHDLLRFWTDDEMRLFHESYSWRPRFEDKTGYVMNPPALSAEAQKAIEIKLALRKNFFDDWDDSHILMEMWHCFQMMFAEHGHDIPVRFAHIRNIEMYDFLDEQQGQKPSRSLLNWTNYIPKLSADEMRRECVSRELKYPDKSKSALYPAKASI